MNRKGDWLAANWYRQGSIEIPKNFKFWIYEKKNWLESNKFVLWRSFWIEWYKNFQEHLTDLKNTVNNERYSFFTWCFVIIHVINKFFIECDFLRNILRAWWKNFFSLNSDLALPSTCSFPKGHFFQMALSQLSIHRNNGSFMQNIFLAKILSRHL